MKGMNSDWNDPFGTSRHDDGLGFSLLLYFAVMAGGLALFVAPVYYINSVEVHANPGLAAYEPPPATNLIPPLRPPEPPIAKQASAEPDEALRAFAEANMRKLNGGRSAASNRVLQQPAERTLSANAPLAAPFARDPSSTF